MTRLFRHITLLLLASLSWLVFAGGAPSGLVEEQVQGAPILTETGTLVQRHGRLTGQPHRRATLQRLLPPAQPRPALEPRCQRTRIRSLPIERRGPPA